MTAVQDIRTPEPKSDFRLTTTTALNTPAQATPHQTRSHRERELHHRAPFAPQSPRPPDLLLYTFDEVLSTPRDLTRRRRRERRGRGRHVVVRGRTRRSAAILVAGRRTGVFVGEGQFGDSGAGHQVAWKHEDEVAVAKPLGTNAHSRHGGQGGGLGRCCLVGRLGPLDGRRVVARSWNQESK